MWGWMGKLFGGQAKSEQSVCFSGLSFRNLGESGGLVQ
jgi:hypothetical protein